MNRAADCSLNLATGSSSLSGSASAIGVTTNYERTLHQLAQLTTTADTYPLGCGGAPGGLSTRAGVILQRKANSPYVFALAAANTSNNAVFILVPSSDLTSASFTALTSLPNATAIITGDFNGDGNGDLLVVNGYNPSSAFVSVVLGNGDGTSRAPSPTPPAATGPSRPSSTTSTAMASSTSSPSPMTRPPLSSSAKAMAPSAPSPLPPSPTPSRRPVGGANLLPKSYWLPEDVEVLAVSRPIPPPQPSPSPRLQAVSHSTTYTLTSSN